jgi:hypothetical protein
VFLTPLIFQTKEVKPPDINAQVNINEITKDEILFNFSLKNVGDIDANNVNRFTIISGEPRFNKLSKNPVIRSGESFTVDEFSPKYNFDSVYTIPIYLHVMYDYRIDDKNIFVMKKFVFIIPKNNLKPGIRDPSYTEIDNNFNCEKYSKLFDEIFKPVDSLKEGGLSIIFGEGITEEIDLWKNSFIQITYSPVQRSITYYLKINSDTSIIKYKDNIKYKDKHFLDFSWDLILKESTLIIDGEECNDSP